MSLGTSMSKSITKIIPRIEGTGSVDFYVGVEMMPNAGVTWKGPYTFTPGVHSEIPVRATSAYVGIRVESEDDRYWELSNLEIHWRPQGMRGNGV